MLASNHEGGPGSTRSRSGHNGLPEAADEASVLKYAIKEVAQSPSGPGTFMSKPTEGLFGSGCHLHQSLLSEDGRANLFFDPDAAGGLSDTVASSYIAGQLAAHADFTAIWAPTTNAYKRLMPYVGASFSWAFANRAVALRVSASDENTARIENRAPGGEANVYLAMAASLAGGLHGITSGLQAPEPSSGSFYEEPTRDHPDDAVTGDRPLRGERGRARDPATVRRSTPDSPRGGRSRARERDRLEPDRYAEAL